MHRIASAGISAQLLRIRHQHRGQCLHLAAELSRCPLSSHSSQQPVRRLHVATRLSQKAEPTLGPRTGQDSQENPDDQDSGKRNSDALSAEESIVPDVLGLYAPDTTTLNHGDDRSPGHPRFSCSSNTTEPREDQSEDSLGRDRVDSQAGSQQRSERQGRVQTSEGEPAKITRKPSQSPPECSSSSHVLRNETDGLLRYVSPIFRYVGLQGTTFPERPINLPPDALPERSSKPQPQAPSGSQRRLPVQLESSNRKGSRRSRGKSSDIKPSGTQPEGLPEPLFQPRPKTQPTLQHKPPVQLDVSSTETSRRLRNPASIAEPHVRTRPEGLPEQSSQSRPKTQPKLQPWSPTQLEISGTDVTIQPGGLPEPSFQSWPEVQPELQPGCLVKLETPGIEASIQPEALPEPSFQPGPKMQPKLQPRRIVQLQSPSSFVVTEPERVQGPSSQPRPKAQAGSQQPRRLIHFEAPDADVMTPPEGLPEPSFQPRRKAQPELRPEGTALFEGHSRIISRDLHSEPPVRSEVPRAEFSRGLENETTPVFFEGQDEKAMAIRNLRQRPALFSRFRPRRDRSHRVSLFDAYEGIEVPPGGRSLESVFLRYIEHVYGLDLNSGKLRQGIPIDEEFHSRIQACEALHDGQSRSFQLAPGESGVLVKNKVFLRDLDHWASLLFTRDVNAVASLFLESSSSGRDMEKEELLHVYPLFLYVYALRRQDISSHALQLFIVHAWQRLQRTPFWIPKSSESDDAVDAFGQVELSTAQSTRSLEHGDLDSIEINAHRKLDMDDVWRLFVRLLRTALRAMPQAMVNLSSLLATYTYHNHDENVSLADDRDALVKVTQRYNRALELIALPTPLHPVVASVYQEEAQFLLLGRMASHRPPLTISNAGYRAVTRVQLARKATAQERDWISLQRPSWPPWKDNKSGLDEAKDAHYGTSRAARSIQRMQEAGYAMGHWEQVARIYAGWDTDNTPTLKVRKLLLHFPKEESTGQMWAARVTATRTLQEAWACFLSCEDSGVPTIEVYRAMFEKIDSHTRLAKRPSLLYDELPGQPGSKDDTPLSGEGREILPTPVSPLDQTFIRSEPPSTEELFDRMFSAGVKPDISLISVLVAKAYDLPTGIKFLSSLGRLAAPLLRISKLRPKDHTPGAVSPKLLSAFVKLLCRSKNVDLSSTSTEGSETSYVLRGFTLQRRHPVVHALHLLLEVRTGYVPAWNNFLEGLRAGPETSLIGVVDRSPYSEDNTILALRLARTAVSMMGHIGVWPDAESFYLVCRIVERAASSRYRLQGSLNILSSQTHSTTDFETRDELDLNRTDELPFSTHRPAHANALFAKSALYVRVLFNRVVGNNTSNTTHLYTSVLPDASLPPVPRFLAIPQMAHLHFYARTLGVLRDHEGMYSLAKWMADAHVEILHRAEQEFSGRRWLRKTFVAMRLFLERPELDRTFEGLEVNPADEELITLVRRTINGVKAFKGWPREHEVEEYVDRGRRDKVAKDMRKGGGPRVRSSPTYYP
ncbi:hypothetical protein K402DRAFT_374175 [Aulographum hederae CBS 113979]|uniref:Uncharacterized protein n=1 Tax=Aulographum hederae CBS 113979 TaxID=1176131 RepID=A0A6G1H5I9_9PEZI|nr:hypothetical protein K402DRAFT_374175 [Aulographum hederae CBS 113979]